MATKDTTRYASSTQENRIAKKFNGHVIPNSGAGKFNKSDVVVKEANLSIECKTCMSEKKSFSIKKDWLKKHKEESFSNRLYNSIIAFNFFYEDKEDYYVIDDKLMKFLVEKLKEDNENSFI